MFARARATSMRDRVPTMRTRMFRSDLGKEEDAGRARLAERERFAVAEALKREALAQRLRAEDDTLLTRPATAPAHLGGGGGLTE